VTVVLPALRAALHSINAHRDQQLPAEARIEAKALAAIAGPAVVISTSRKQAKLQRAERAQADADGDDDREATARVQPAAPYQLRLRRRLHK
jgi:hypothetical protein